MSPLKYKKCTRCKKDLILNLENFYFNKSRQQYKSQCRNCFDMLKKKRTDLYRIKFLGDKVNRNLKRKYGITSEDYNLLFENQKGRCAICGTHQKDLSKRLFVDHDHKTGEIRGLLCIKCNNGIGLFSNNPKITDRATKYLSKKIINYEY